MGGSASQNPQAMAPLELMQCTVAIATPPLCPDHRSTSTDQVREGPKMWFFFFFFAQLCPVSPTSPVSFTSWESWAGLMFSASLSSQNKDTSPSSPFCNTFLPHKQGKGAHRPSPFWPLLLFSSLLRQLTLRLDCPDGGATVLHEWIKHIFSP